MDQMDESLKKQIAALLRVIHVTRCSKEDNVPCQIEEGLFLGSIGAANNKEELKNLNITHILTVANSFEPSYPNDFVYKIINVADRVSTDLKQHFDECIDYIDEAKRSGGGVLVHCFVGRSRSVTIVVAYLMKKHGMNLSQALEHVKSRRPQAAPNSGFISQLQSFERALHVYNNIFLADLMELLNLSREFVGNDTVGNVNIVDDFRGLLLTAFDSVLKK